MPARLLHHAWVRRLPLTTAGGAVALAVTLPWIFTTSDRQFLFTWVVLFALAGLSVRVVTGWGGNLSLAQFAFVALGAMVTAGLTSRGIGFGVAVLYATVAGVLAAVVVEAPALRIRYDAQFGSKIESHTAR